MDGKTVLITGASRGIGEAAARAFANEGANVVLAARSTDAIAAIDSDIGETALAVPCDVSRASDLQAAVDAAVRPTGVMAPKLATTGEETVMSPRPERVSIACGCLRELFDAFEPMSS